MPIFPQPFINPFDKNLLFHDFVHRAYPYLVKPRDFTEDPSTPTTFLRWALHKAPINPAFQRPDYDCDYNNPATLHSEMQSLGALTHPGTADQSWRVELARFSCPYGVTGIIRAVEQFLSTVDGQSETVVWSSNQHWGNSVNAPGTLHFRVQQITRPLPWLNELNPATKLPGQPYPDWSAIAGLWYPAGSAASQNHHLVVPAGYMLRAIWVYEGGDYIPTVAVTLRGSRHNQFAKETKPALRLLW